MFMSFTLSVCYGMLENPETEPGLRSPEEKHGVFGHVQFSAFFNNTKLASTKAVHIL